MKTTNRLWLLGAADPEMEAIEELLESCAESFQYAEIDGRRVHPGNAYRAEAPELPEGVTGYAVECVDVLPPGWIRIDHHRPGDSGYGRPPEEFLAASSIGQVSSHLAVAGSLDGSAWDSIPWLEHEGEEYTLGQLGWSARTREGDPWLKKYVDRLGSVGSIVRLPDRGGDWGGSWGVVLTDETYCGGVEGSITVIPTEIVLAAAADHCLAAAYDDECHGVDPDELMQWRASSRAAFQQRPVAEVLADVERARARIGGAFRRELAPHIEVLDLRGESIPELPEAACREGVAVLATAQDRDGREKVVLMGDCAPAVVRAFLEHWAPRHGLVDLYGDPARGFAGGYLPGGGS